MYEWATLFSCSPSIWSLPRYVVDGTKLNVAGWRGVVASPTTSRLLLLFLIGKRRTRTEMIAPTHSSRKRERGLAQTRTTGGSARCLALRYFFFFPFFFWNVPASRIILRFLSLLGASSLLVFVAAYSISGWALLSTGQCNSVFVALCMLICLFSLSLLCSCCLVGGSWC